MGAAGGRRVVISKMPMTCSSMRKLSLHSGAVRRPESISGIAETRWHAGMVGAPSKPLPVSVFNLSWGS
jgi:hypothetical protein